MGSFTRKTIAMVLSLAMMITLFAGLGFMEVNAQSAARSFRLALPCMILQN